MTYKNNIGYKYYGYKKCCVLGSFYSFEQIPTKCLFAKQIIDNTIGKQLNKNSFVLGFIPCKKCSKKIIKGKYTKLSDIFDFDRREEYSQYIEAIKKAVPCSDDDKEYMLDDISSFNNFKDGDIIKYDMNDIVSQLSIKYKMHTRIIKKLLKYNN